MNELADLYEEIILDHNKNPRYFNKIPDGANRRAEGDNPLCGDHYTIHLHVENGIVEDVGFEGSGCAISKASASLMLESMKGKTEAEAAELFNGLHGMLTGEGAQEPKTTDFGKLEVLSGVCKYPMRVKCATLAWHVFNAAMQDTEPSVSTE
jgi:nitrogen fixation NifU-like protein